MIKITCNRREKARDKECGEKAVVLFMSVDDTDWSASDWLVEAACAKHGPITAHEWGRTGEDWVLVDLSVGPKLDRIRAKVDGAGMIPHWDLREIIDGKPTPAKTTNSALSGKAAAS